MILLILAVVALVAIVGGIVAVAAGGAVKRNATKSTETVPGIAAVVPEHWFGSHEPEAVLHRRVQKAYLGIKASADDDLTLLDATTTAETQAIKLAKQLVACSHLADRLKPPVLADLERSVERYEEIAAQVIGRSSGLSSPQLSSELHELGHQLDILEAARAEVEEADGSTG
ncbi:MAG: hypothetical protein R2710_20740 [Acidimicrobiales bacterium]